LRVTLAALLCALTLAAPANAAVLTAPDWAAVPDGARAPDHCATAGRTVFPGTKSTPWNVRCGGPLVVKETIDGRAALHFHIPAGYQSDEGSARAEQEPAVPNITAGQTVYWGYDIKAAPFPTRLAWQLVGQFKNDGIGSPTLGVSLDGQAGAGFGAFDVYTGQRVVLFTDASQWRRVVWRFSPAAPGQRGVVQAWVDGQLAYDASWALIRPDRSSAYLKFGAYGPPAGFPRDVWFARMRVATTLEEALGTPAPEPVPPVAARFEHDPAEPVTGEPVAFRADVEPGDSCEWQDRPPGTTTVYVLAVGPCSMTFTFRNPGVKYVAVQVSRDGRQSAWTYRDGGTDRSRAAGLTVRVPPEPTPEPTPTPTPSPTPEPTC